MAEHRARLPHRRRVDDRQHLGQVIAEQIAMFLAASRAVSALARGGRLLPDLEDIREVSAQVAKAVACEARDSGLGRRLSDEEYGRAIRRAQWQPRYYTLRAGR